MLRRSQLPDVPKPGYRFIFVKWITDRKTGQRRYPKTGKAFRLEVKN